MIAFRDATAKKYGFELLVHKNPEGMAMGINPFDHGSSKHTDIMKTQGLKQALNKYGFDAAFGGARRDEENLVRKSVSIHSAIRTTPGTRKTSVLSCGKPTTARSTKAKAFVCSHCRTGPNWISGNTST